MDSTLYKQLPFIIKRDDTTNIEVECNITQDSKVEFCTTMINYAGNAFFGDVATSSSTNAFLLDYSQFFVGKNDVAINTELNKKYTFILKGKGYTEMNGKVIHEDTFDWNFSKNFLVIAGAFRTGSYISCHQYFYYCKIYEDGTNLSYHLVPCKRLSDNIVGLYDLVNDKFYTPSRGTYKEPFNLNGVTSIQIPEGNVTKIEDKEGKILWANINKLAYGVRWNSVNQATTACERIGNLELHKTLPIQSRFKVCIHKGKEIQYYCHPDDSRFVEDSKKAEFTHQKADMNLTACDGLPTGVVSCEENSVVNCKFINEDLFSNYRFLYSYVYIQDNVSNAMAIGRIVYIDTDTHEAYIDDSENIQLSGYVHNESVDRYKVYEAIDRPWFSDNYTVELGCSINGYDGEIGVDTGGKFYQWSVDNDGDGNEVWQSLYKCVPYAREIKRHIIGIDRACVLNTAFNDTKWGWIGSLEANTAVNVINYHVNLRGGANDSQFNASERDKYLGVDNFRCQLGKARTNLNLAAMRSYSQKTDGGQMLYKQIWEAIVWSYIIEYANFDVKKAYNAELTTEGYHQGGLDNGATDVLNEGDYHGNQKLVTNDYTLEFGNKTNIKFRAARQYDIPITSWSIWQGYNTKNVVATITNNNKVLAITNTKVLTTDWNICANADKVGGVVRYKITGLTDDQTVVFKREQGNLTITTDGTYDVNWGTSNVQRKIYFGKLQTNCNIVIGIISAPDYNMIKNQPAFSVPHWRGFNVFWYGDIEINLDNMLSEYDTTKQKRIWYYTDDVSKFSDGISNKEHQIEGIGDVEDWLKEIRINDKGDIVPSKVIDDAAYKNSYCTNYVEEEDNYTAFAGSNTTLGFYAGLLSLNVSNTIYYSTNDAGFVKVTILDN